MLSKQGLFLLPNLLDKTSSSLELFPSLMLALVPGLDGLIAESEKEGRIFLRRFFIQKEGSCRDLPIAVLNEHSTASDLALLVQRIKKGGKWGLISDAGLPVIADPGADLVFCCHREKVAVYPLPGPSALFYALMLSGFSAQNFTFSGYLPREESSLQRKIKALENQLRKEKQTQVFIETPYRTLKLLRILLQQLSPATYLAVAWNVTWPNEGVRVRSVADWRRLPMEVPSKALAVFLLGVPCLQQEREKSSALF